jgi:hypothetical protein
VTPTVAAKALLYVALHFPFGNVALQRKIETFARALPRLAPASAPAARLWVEKLGLVDQSPWKLAMLDALATLDPLPPEGLRNTLLRDLSRAACCTAIQAEPERRATVFALLDRAAPR